jgi:SAM-dependent methyltransferase
MDTLEPATAPGMRGRTRPLPTKLNLGCGADIRPGYLNLDVAPLPGVDVVHNLATLPYPFADDEFEEIVAYNILEHLPDTIGVLEEIWRISRPGGSVHVRVPYWNSLDGITDPTHVRWFNQYTFQFFDPTSERCRRRPYYTRARFRITEEAFFTRVPRRYVRVAHPALKKVLTIGAHFLCNVIRMLEYRLTVVK